MTNQNTDGMTEDEVRRRLAPVVETLVAAQEVEGLRIDPATALYVEKAAFWYGNISLTVDGDDMQFHAEMRVSDLQDDTYAAAVTETIIGTIRELRQMIWEVRGRRGEIKGRLEVEARRLSELGHVLEVEDIVAGPFSMDPEHPSKDLQEREEDLQYVLYGKVDGRDFGPIDVWPAYGSVPEKIEEILVDTGLKSAD